MMSIKDDFEYYLQEVLLAVLVNRMEEMERTFNLDGFCDSPDTESFSGIHGDDLVSIINLLNKKEYIKIVEDKYADPHFFVTKDGQEHYKSELKDRSSIAWKHKFFGEGWSESAFFRFQALLGKSDDTKRSKDDSQKLDGQKEQEWEPLPIEREGKAYDEAVRETERAIEIIESDNGYAANETNERNQIVWSLKAGLESIQAGLPNQEQVKVYLLAPFQYLAKKFSDASIGVAAKAAASAIIKWLIG